MTIPSIKLNRALSVVVAVATLGFPTANAEAQIKDGTTVNIKNSYTEVKGEYLDARFWVKNIPELKGVDETTMVLTADQTNRDSGSGSWMIRKVDLYLKNYKAGDGTQINFGDTIYVISRYPNAGFLDVWEKPVEAVKGELTGNDKDNLMVFASTKRDRNGRSSQWKVVPANDTKKEGEPVVGSLRLESVQHPGFYLETHGILDPKLIPSLKLTDANVHGVYITKEGAHAGSNVWGFDISPHYKDGPK